MIDTINKLQPQDLDMEQTVLGSIMTSDELFEHIQNLFTPDLFYFPKHQLIAQAILNLKRRNEPIDILTVTKELKGKNITPYDVTQIGGKFIGQERIIFFTQILFQKYILRTLIKECTLTINQAHDSELDPIELLEHTDKTIKGLFDMMKTSQIKNANAIYDETIEAMRQASNNNGIVGESTGLIEYDQIINGLQPTFVYIIAARPSMGKSALMKSIARACVDNKVPCSINSLEMSSVQMMKGLLSDWGDINNKILESGKLSNDEWDKILKYKGTFNNLLFIDDTPSITIQYLESNVRRLVKEFGVKVILIDYIQLMELSKSDKQGKTRDQEVGYISKNIKRIAKQYKIAIVILAQLSRSVDDRKPPRPILSDLRESGNLEQDADVVTFIYRPAYYKIFTDADGNDLSNSAELIVAKNRFGQTKSAYVNFVKEKTKFENMPIIPPKTIYSSFDESQNYPF